jgi:hypothetical protein
MPLQGLCSRSPPNRATDVACFAISNAFLYCFDASLFGALRCVCLFCSWTSTDRDAGRIQTEILCDALVLVEDFWVMQARFVVVPAEHRPAISCHCPRPGLLRGTLFVVV